MALARFSQGIVEINGKMGGVYFHKDRYGHHLCRNPRSVNRRTPAQMSQRQAFYAAKHPVPPKPPPPVGDYNVTGTLTPDATCNYLEAGTYEGRPYYQREDGAWFIWWYEEGERWYINQEIGNFVIPLWCRETYIEGEYEGFNGAEGIAIVSVGAH